MITIEMHWENIYSRINQTKGNFSYAHINRKEIFADEIRGKPKQTEVLDSNN